jgi:methionyl-tRNA formyltransferase
MRLVFMGTPDSAVQSLRQLIADGLRSSRCGRNPINLRARKIAPVACERFAATNFPVHQPLKIKTLNEELFAGHQADAAIVVAYGRILRWISERPPWLHQRPLRTAKVSRPLVNWAIVLGERNGRYCANRGRTRHRSGAPQRATEIGKTETAPEQKRLAEMGAELLSETLKGLESIELKRTK